MKVILLGLILCVLFAIHKTNGQGYGQFLLLVDVVDFNFIDKNVFNGSNNEGPLSLTGCVSLPDGPSCHVGSASVQIKGKWFPTLIILLKNITEEHQHEPFRLLVTACNNGRILQYINRTILLKDVKESVLFQEKNADGSLSVEVDMFDILSPRANRFDYEPQYGSNNKRTFWEAITEPTDRELSYIVLILFSILVVLLAFCCVVNCIKCCIGFKHSKSQTYDLANGSGLERFEEPLDEDDRICEAGSLHYASDTDNILEIPVLPEPENQTPIAKHQRQPSNYLTIEHQNRQYVHDDLPDDPRYFETSTEIVV